MAGIPKDLRRVHSYITACWNPWIEKDHTRDPSDKFISFAKARKLSFAVVRIGERGPSPDWSFMSIAEGRNRYRQIIDEVVAAAVARRVA